MNELPTPTLPLSPVSLPRGSLHRPDHELSEERGSVLVSWARHQDEVREAQQLRYEVFATEMGARLDTWIPGHDVDLFDDYCEHLLVRDSRSFEVIGTYRVLTPVQALRVGSTYSDTEFDLTRLRGLRERMVELGRSCVHADHRHGGVILALWGALAEFMTRNRLDTMIGCASIPMLHEGNVSGDAAASIWSQVSAAISRRSSSTCVRVCRCRWRHWMAHSMPSRRPIKPASEMRTTFDATLSHEFHDGVTAVSRRLHRLQGATHRDSQTVGNQ